MPSQDLMRAVQLARAGEKDAARRILLRLVQEDPTDEMIWIWLVDTMPSDAQRIATLKQCLKHLPGSEHARKALAILQARQPAPPDAMDDRTTQPEFAPAAKSETPPVSPSMYQDEIEPLGLDSLRQLSGMETIDRAEQNEPAPFDEPMIEPALDWRIAPPVPQPTPSQPVEESLPEPSSIDSQTLTDLRSQLGKAPAAPMETVKAAIEAVEIKRSSISPLMLILIVLLAILAGLVGFTLFFSPLSPLRAGMAVPPAAPTNQPSDATPLPVTTQAVGAPVATEEVTLTPPEEENDAQLPLPPGIYLGGSQVYSIDWSRDGAYFVVSSNGGISIYDPRTYNTLRFLDLAGSPIDCRFSPDVKRLVCAGADLRVWQIPDWEQQFLQTPTSVSEEGWINRFEFLDAQTLGLLLVNDPIGVNYWSFEVLGVTGERLRAPESIRRLAVAQQGGWLAAGLENGVTIVWNLNTGEAVFQQQVSRQPVDLLALSADGSQLVTVSEALIRFWDVASGEQQLEIDAGAPLSAIALSADGESLAAAGEDGGLIFWEPLEGEILDRREVGGAVVELLFAPDGQALAVLKSDGNIFFYYGWR